MEDQPAREKIGQVDAIQAMNMPKKKMPAVTTQNAKQTCARVCYAKSKPKKSSRKPYRNTQAATLSLRKMPEKSCLKPSLLRREDFSFRSLLFSFSRSLLRERASLRRAFLFFCCTTTMLVGRALRPRPSTPESHRPLVVMGLKTDFAFLVRGSEDAGLAERSEAGASAEGAARLWPREGGEAGVAGSTTRISALCLLSRSSSVSARG